MKKVDTNNTTQSNEMSAVAPTSQRLSVPIKVESWNTIATAHWRVYSRKKDEAKQATEYALLPSPLQPIAGQVTIEIDAYYADNRRHDLDNLFVKPILDVLVERGIIKDDNAKIVRSLTSRVHLGAIMDRVDVTIRQYETDRASG